MPSQRDKRCHRKPILGSALPTAVAFVFSGAFWGVFFSFFSGACSVDSNADRAAWLHATLVADRYGDLKRSPLLVEKQFDRMAGDPYLFMRATLPQFRRDLAEPFTNQRHSIFLSSASSRVQLMGDPHIENIGSYRVHSGAMAIEFNDFDSAVYGPYTLDVWRLALSWYAFGAASHFTRTYQEDWLDLAEQVARGYAGEMLRLADGTSAETLTKEIAETTLLSDVLKKARKRGDSQATLNDFTRVSSEAIREFRYDREDLAGTAPDVQQWIADSLPAWLATLPNQGSALGPLKASARRFGSGVASLFLRRYYLLFEGPTLGADDDLLVEWKEARDPCFIATGSVEPARRFASNGQRVIAMQRRAQADPTSDDYAGWVGNEPWSFESRRDSGFRVGLDKKRIAKHLRDGRWTIEEVLEASEATGRLLAQSHARAQTATGGAAASAVADLLRGHEDEFARETRQQISLMGRRLEDDFRLFKILRERYGPGLRVGL